MMYMALTHVNLELCRLELDEYSTSDRLSARKKNDYVDSKLEKIIAFKQSSIMP